MLDAPFVSDLSVTGMLYATGMTRRSFLAAIAGLVGLGGWWLSEQMTPAASSGAAASAIPDDTLPLAKEPAAATTTRVNDQPAGASLEVISRVGWGALAAIDGEQVPHTIERLTYHHTAGSDSENSLVPGRFRQFQLLHMEQGWTDIAYHFLIDRAGNVYEGRPVEIAGDTGTNYDPAGHFLPVMEGDFTLSPPTERQLASLAAVLAWASDSFGVDVADLGAHRDYAATACPGDLAYALRDDIAARSGLLIRQGGVVLDRLSDFESGARVGAIESSES